MPEISLLKSHSSWISFSLSRQFISKWKYPLERFVNVDGFILATQRHPWNHLVQASYFIWKKQRSKEVNDLAQGHVENKNPAETWREGLLIHSSLLSPLPLVQAEYGASGYVCTLGGYREESQWLFHYSVWTSPEQDSRASSFKVENLSVTLTLTLLVLRQSPYLRRKSNKRNWKEYILFNSASECVWQLASMEHVQVPSSLCLVCCFPALPALCHSSYKAFFARLPLGRAQLKTDSANTPIGILAHCILAR